LATFWLTKSLVCIDAFIRDSTIQSDVRRFCTPYKSEEFGSLSAVWTMCHPVPTLICPLFHPSKRHAIPSGLRQTKHHPFGRRGFPSRPFTILRSFCSSLHPSGRLSSPSGRLSVINQASDSFQVQIWEDCFNRPDDVVSHPDARLHKASSHSNSTVRTSVCHGPDARSTDMEIADLTSTVRTPAYHGPDARTRDMEIAC
jgi:hypothetical protein